MTQAIILLLYFTLETVSVAIYSCLDRLGLSDKFL